MSLLILTTHTISSFLKQHLVTFAFRPTPTDSSITLASGLDLVLPTPLLRPGSWSSLPPLPKASTCLSAARILGCNSLYDAAITLRPQDPEEVVLGRPYSSFHRTEARTFGFQSTQHHCCYALLWQSIIANEDDARAVSDILPGKFLEPPPLWCPPSWSPSVEPTANSHSV